MEFIIQNYPQEAVSIQIKTFSDGQNRITANGTACRMTSHGIVEDFAFQKMQQVLPVFPIKKVRIDDLNQWAT